MTRHKRHQYHINVAWTGNLGEGTRDYRAYSRNHEIQVEGKAVVKASSDPAFLGDAGRHNPEELLVSSLSSCHMLWYLHLCSQANIMVVGYQDPASGVMAETADGGGYFEEVVLRPEVTIASGDAAEAERLHERAHHLCFIANSVNFPVRCEPTVRVLNG